MDQSNLVANGQFHGRFLYLGRAQAKLVVLGCEEGVLQCWDVETGTLTHDFVGHKSRVRGLSVTDLPLHEDAVEGKTADSTSLPLLLPSLNDCRLIYVYLWRVQKCGIFSCLARPRA